MKMLEIEESEILIVGSGGIQEGSLISVERIRSI